MTYQQHLIYSSYKRLVTFSLVSAKSDIPNKFVSLFGTLEPNVRFDVVITS